MKIRVFCWRANNCGNSTAFCCNIGNRNMAFVNEVVEFEKIAGRIAGNSQLGKNNKLSASILCLPDGRFYLFDVAFKIPDMIVYLRKGNFHKFKI